MMMPVVVGVVTLSGMRRALQPSPARDSHQTSGLTADERVKSSHDLT